MTCTLAYLHACLTLARSFVVVVLVPNADGLTKNSVKHPPLRNVGTRKEANVVAIVPHRGVALCSGARGPHQANHWRSLRLFRQLRCCGGRSGILRWALRLLTDSGATHLALHQPPWIIGIGARAAPPELRRIQVHGDRLIVRLCCGLCALTFLSMFC